MHADARIALRRFRFGSPAWLHWRNLKELLSQTADQWSKDNAQRLGASLAFYSLLSASPLLVIMVAIAALVFGEDAVQGQIIWQVRNLMGPVGAPVVEALLVGAHHFSAGTVPGLIGLLTLLFGASSVVIELQDALNIIWGGASASAGTNTFLASTWKFMQERFFSFFLVIGSGLPLIFSLMWSAWRRTLPSPTSQLSMTRAPKPFKWK